MDLSAYQTVFDVFVFLFGASIGSFLNVVIYRLPHDLSISKPARSFCPSCQTPIPWHQNLPLVSWLMLRGRCAKCGTRIAFRYFAVELITALLFLAVWRVFPLPVAIAYWVFISLVLAATFIDFEHFIIPDEITIGGAVAGVAASVLVPALMNSDSRLVSGVRSLLAAALGYVILWIVLEAGKLAFGKKRIRLEAPTPFSWQRQNDDADFAVGEERSLWSDYFARESDRLILHCLDAKIDHRSFGTVTLEFHYNRVAVAGETFALDQVNEMSGTARELVIPREAMGRGDLKFLAAIGAFLGWRGVLFSLFGGSLIGSLVGVLALIVGKRVWSAKLPFGPYLAFGAVLWMFCGEALVRWYSGWFIP